jgi:hypothetical protein
MVDDRIDDSSDDGEHMQHDADLEDETEAAKRLTCAFGKTNAHVSMHHQWLSDFEATSPTSL